MMETLRPQRHWQTIDRPGYLGKRKGEMFVLWDSNFGKDNWRLINETSKGEVLNYNDIIWKVYVPGYVAYFYKHPDEARFITSNYSYGYDKDIISREEAFDPYALYNKPGVPNQFHHVALNISLEWYLGLPFKGVELLHVREGKPGTPETEQPNGYRWSPGRIPSTRPDLISTSRVEGWWSSGSIEDFYQSSKVLQILK